MRIEDVVRYDSRNETWQSAFPARGGASDAEYQTQAWGLLARLESVRRAFKTSRMTSMPRSTRPFGRVRRALGEVWAAA